MIEGGILEGSDRFGGMQPDYLLDWNSRRFHALRERARTIRTMPISLWEKVAKIQFLINEALPDGRYRAPRYLDLMRNYRERGEAVPLSRYMEIGSGVCRENAIIQHFLLREAGIPNRYVYAKTTLGDHAFNTIEWNGSDWIVDSYFRQLNGSLQKITIDRVLWLVEAIDLIAEIKLKKAA